MKKLLLICAAILAGGTLFAQTDCSDILISEYVEGWNNNKALELYNPTSAAITLDGNYRLIRFSNGSSTSDQEVAYNLPLTGTIAPYKVMVIIQDTIPAGQDTMVWAGLRKKATWLAPYAYATAPPYTQGGNVVFWNGDDAVSLQKKQTNNTWKDLDIFGEIGVRPTNWQGTYSPSGAWTDTKPYILGVGQYLTKSKTLIRKRSVKHGIDRLAMIQYGSTTTGGVPNSFNALLEYDSMPANFFDSLGFHTCDCKNSAGIGKITFDQQVTVSPNPVTGNHFTLQSNTPFIAVEVVSIVGQAVYSREFASRQNEVAITLNNLPDGIYLVRVRYPDNQTVIKKIVIQ